MSELIDRQALLDECLNHYEVGNIEQNCTMDWICKTVRNFPTASPWHRVEEELPDKTTTVLVWVGVNYDGMGMYPEMRTALWHTVSKHFFVHHDESIRGPIIGNVTHWMPLPEPPKEEEHGN